MSEIEKYDDEWVDVSDDLPMIQRGFKQVSVNVLVKLDDGQTGKAYYAHDRKEWFTEDSKRIHEIVVAWKSL